jgi:drug/metabolite transporter (DMT)-like permease
MKESREGKDQFFLIGMIFSMFCWGLSWASGKVLAAYGSAPNLSLFRFVFTFISLFIILIITKENLKIDRKGYGHLLVSSVLMTIYNYFFFKGLFLGKAGAGGVLVTILNPIVAYAITLILAKRRPTSYETIGLIIGLLAGAILLKIWESSNQLWSAGNSFFILASFTWAVLSLFTSKSGRYGSPVAFSLWLYGISTFTMLLLSDFNESIHILKIADFYFWFNLIFSAVITTAIATTFYFVATSKLGASKASSFIFMVPFSAALGSWIFLNEVPKLHTIFGGLLGIAAVYILNKK